MTRLLLKFVLGSAVGLSFGVPILYWSYAGLPSIHFEVWLFLNCIAWCLVAYWGYYFIRLYKQVTLLARRAGDSHPFRSLEEFIEGVRRKEAAFGISLEISDRALFKNINAILNASRELLPISGSELTLKDRESGLYHGSFLSGKPFKSDLGVSLRRAASLVSPLTRSDGIMSTVEAEDVVYLLPVRIAGVDVAVLRVRKKSDVHFKETDWRVLDIVLLQCTRALVESEFIGQLVRMREESEAAVKSKTGFLAHLSHEIRGPLGIMLNAVELVLEELCGEITPDQRETLGMVKQNGSHLLDLVNDVLDYAKVEAGRMTTERDQIQASELLKDIANITHKFAETKKHELNVLFPDDSIYFICDRRQARQILINLLTNAVKYTPDGGRIEVWVDVGVSHLKINVQDTGIGIAPQDREKVFAPFERIEQGYARNQKGTGIGMNLTRQLVELNEGRIDFDSSVGQGSHFWVEFQLVQGAASESVQTSMIDQAEIDGNGLNVLVLSAEVSECSMIARYLSHHHFEVIASTTLAEASAVLEQGRADVMVLDLKLVGDDMPLATALEALRASSANGRWIPIVALTGEAFHSDLEELLRAGVDRCVVKPLSLSDLVRACWEVVH